MENSSFSGWLQPDWGNTARAAMARLGTIVLGNGVSSLMARARLALLAFLVTNVREAFLVTNVREGSEALSAYFSKQAIPFRVCRDFQTM